MPIPCPPDFESWLESPETVRVFSYVKDAIVFPLHLLGAYCILKKTPGSMSSMKLTLLNFHFWNVMLDLMMNILSIPIILLPMPATTLVGLLSSLGMRPTIQLLIMMTIVSCEFTNYAPWDIQECAVERNGGLVFHYKVSGVSVSTTMIFENRFFLLNSKKTWWKRFRPFWMILNFSFAFLYQVPIILNVPDQARAREVVMNSLPCVPSFLEYVDIVVPSLDETIIMISSTVFMTVIFGQLIAFAIILTLQLSSNFGANMLSETTRRLQKELLKALIWQTGIPVLYLLLPACYSTFSFAADYFSMPLNNLVATLSSLHGLVSTLSIILIHKPYRSTVTFWNKEARTDSRVVNPIFSTNTGAVPQ